MEIRRLTAFMMALFVPSILLLGLKLLSPASFKIALEGSEASVIPLTSFYTLTDVVIVAVSSLLLGISAMYLLFLGPVSEITSAQTNLPQAILEERRKKWRERASSLKEDEQKAYQAILDSDGIILQSKVIEKRGFIKAKVSRCLEALEIRGLIERKRGRMSNVVLLK